LPPTPILFLGVGAFDDDGGPDVAVASAGSSDVPVLRGNGDGTFPAPQNFGVSRIAQGPGGQRGRGRCRWRGMPDLAVASPRARGEDPRW